MIAVLDSGRRIVGNDSQLLDLVVDAVALVEAEDVQGKDGQVQLLWCPVGRAAGAGGLVQQRPRDEADLSDLLRKHLRVRLGMAAVNREVEVVRRRADQPGQRIDLIVSVPTPYRRHTVVVEVKPCWSDELATTIPEQLGRYLRDNPECSAGLLLVGRYDSPAWDPSDSRRALARRQTPASMASTLDAQARALGNELGKDVRVSWINLALGSRRE